MLYWGLALAVLLTGAARLFAISDDRADDSVGFNADDTYALPVQAEDAHVTRGDIISHLCNS